MITLSSTDCGLSLSCPLSDDFRYNYEDVDFSDAEDAFSEVEGIATVSFDSSAQNGLQIIEENIDHLDIPDEMEDGSQTGSPKRWSGWSSQTPDLDVVCTDYGFQVTFMMGPLSEVKILGMYLTTSPPVD